ncbi:hypothetical protein AXF15_02530 [Desulfomicrobium orale DSM 12838]|uniref:Uncharacterized protein n=1 Tax=Desulfomicrobium orale DSM 12838 TaxID=888061 RepID=A0A109W5H2_9BACT|nr:hypothetical protein AXF15_02530 [Desulfomicrobium orale DSM 12838]
MAGFEVRSFRPFIPGVDEDESLVLGQSLECMGAGLFKPLLILGRSCSSIDKGIVSAAGSVVPTWANTREKWKGRVQTSQGLLIHFFVGDNRTREI